MRSLGKLLLSLAGLWLLSGCGHPASNQECQEIVKRITTLELEKTGGATDAQFVGQEVAQTQRDLAQNTMKDCVGKRITEHAMQCVRKAKTSAEIVDDCFK